MTEHANPDDRIRKGAARPQRPGMERTPGPVSVMQLRPGTITRGLRILRTAVAVGAIAVVTGFIWRSNATNSLVERLENSAAEETTRQQAVDIVLFGTLGLMALFLVFELLLASRVAVGSVLSRAVLTLMIPVHVATLYALHEAIVQETWHGTVIMLCLLVQSLLSLLALVSLWHPRSSRWLREVRKDPVRTTPAGEG